MSAAASAGWLAASRFCTRATRYRNASTLSPGEPNGLLQRVVRFCVLADLLQRLREPGERFPAAAESVGVLRERYQGLELFRRPRVLAPGREDPAERQSCRDAPAVFLQEPHQGRFRILEPLLLPSHHCQAHEGDFTAGLRHEDSFEALRGFVEPTQAGQTVRQGQAERLIVGMVGRTLLVERDDLGEGFFGRSAGNLAVAKEIVHHLTRFRLARFDAKRLKEVVECLLPVSRGETELRQQQQLDESVRDAADDLAKMYRSFLTALQGGKQASQLGAAAEVFGIEADRLAQRRDRARGGVGIVSGSEAVKVHRAERPVGGRGVRIPLHGFRGGRFRRLQVAGGEAEVGDLNEWVDCLGVEFGRPPVSRNRFVTLPGHLRNPAFAEHPVGLGNGIDRDRIVSRVFGRGLLRGLFGGKRFLGTEVRAGEQHEKRQQCPKGHPGHGTGIYRCRRKRGPADGARRPTKANSARCPRDRGESVKGKLPSAGRQCRK